MNKKLISVLCASALLLSSIACGCSSNDSASGGDNTQNGSGTAASSDNTGSADGADQAVSDSINTQKTCVFTVNGQKVYNSGAALYIIKDDDTFECAEMYKEEQTSEESDTNNSIVIGDAYIPANGVVIGNDAYGFVLSTAAFHHWNMDDLNGVRKTTVYERDNALSVVEAALKKAAPKFDGDVSELSESLAEDLFDSNEKLVDGGDGYIYGIYKPSWNLYSSAQPMACYVYRIAEDGSKFEFLDDIRAADFIIKDDYIYYYNCGHSYNIDKQESYIDENSVGIYKMKLDGSDKQQIVNMTLSDEQKENLYNSMFTAGRIDIINNELYYIGTDSYLYKMALGGCEPEKVIQKECNNYYIDTSSGMLYYVNGKYHVASSEGYPLISVPLSGGDEKEIWKNYTNTSSSEGAMTVDGKYLYFLNSDKYQAYIPNYINADGEKVEESGNQPIIICGKRLNLETGEAETLNRFIDITVEKEEVFGTSNVKSVGDSTIEWTADDGLVYLF